MTGAASTGSARRRLVIVLGAPRSGTTWVQAMLGAHPRICTTGELMLFNLYTVAWTEAWRHQQDLAETGGVCGLPLVWGEDDFTGFLREFLDRVYDRVAANRPAAEVIVDKHPGYSGHTAHIDRLRPDARFIHVIRDGRDVAASMMAAAGGWGKAWAPAEVESAAATWRGFVRGGRGGKKLGEDRYLEVRYEEIHADPVSTLLRMFAFAGVDADRGEAERIVEEHRFEKMKKSGKSGGGAADLPDGFFRRGMAGGWRESLSPGARYRVELVAGEELRALGYEAARGWWADRGWQRFTVPIGAAIAPGGRREARLARVLRRELGSDIARYRFELPGIVVGAPRVGRATRARRALGEIAAAIRGNRGVAQGGGTGEEGS